MNPARRKPTVAVLQMAGPYDPSNTIVPGYHYREQPRPATRQTSALPREVGQHRIAPGFANGQRTAAATLVSKPA